MTFEIKDILLPLLAGFSALVWWTMRGMAGELLKNMGHASEALQEGLKEVAESVIQLTVTVTKLSTIIDSQHNRIGTIEDEIVRIRERYHDLTNTVQVVLSRTELLLKKDPRS